MSEANENDEEMMPERDFSGGIRGKHYRSYRDGHTVRIQREDGTIDVQHFTLTEGAVMLDPDVRQFFPDSESVNHALRTLIQLVSRQTQQPSLES